MIDFNYLKEYREDISIISYEEVKDTLSAPWRRVFSDDDNNKRNASVIALWEEFCAVEMRNTIMYLKDNLVSVELIKSSIGVSVLYEMKMGDGTIDYYEGRLPDDNCYGDIPFWNDLPESIRNLYSNVHNGFYYYPSNNMGLMPLQSVDCMNDYDWSIIEDLNISLELKLESSYMLFETGMGGYVVLDTSNKTDENATIWFSNKKPIFNKNFWDVVDEWMVLGFE